MRAIVVRAALLVVLAACDTHAGAQPARIAARPVAIALGEAFSCALRPDGSVWCWGEKDEGQLGTSDSEQRRSPVRVRGLTRAIDLSAARSYACAVLHGGAVWCWGDEGFGRVSGRGDVFGPQPPRRVEGIADAVQVATGEYHACARRRDGSVWCWGRNSDGELGFAGVESAATEMHAPAPVPGIAGATDVSAFRARTCAVAGGHVLCWGRGAMRLADDGSSGAVVREPVRASEIPPERVAGIERARRVFTGTYGACALRDDESLWCWGANQCSQSVPGGASAAVAAPTRAIERVRSAGLGGGTTCVAGADGSVRCWGCGDGMLGDGSTSPRYTPGVVRGVSAAHVSIHSDHACAIATDGRVWCWGSNYAGRLGIGRADDDVVPSATAVRFR